ncbi:MAG TPA: DUF4328 domain-containing protein [Tepidisphaeraceae bacterium]|nr:DUF4328 domain-containing protein [Tepidisphaeraceae bacterium]
MLWGGDPVYISQPIRVERAMANYWLKQNSNSLAEGPYSASQLKAMAAAGHILPAAMISIDREKWTPATQVKGLFPSPTAPAPIPAPTIPPPPPDVAPPPAPALDAYDVQEPQPPPVPPPGTFNAGVPGQTINPVQLAYAGSYGVGGFSGYGVVGKVRNVKWFLITAIVIVALFTISQVLSGASQVFFARTSTTTLTPRSSRLGSRSAPPAPGQLAAVAATGALSCFSQLALIGMAIYWLVWIGTIHSELYAFSAAEFPTSPGMAVGFCFIPFFNLYWIPAMMYKAANGIDLHLGGGRISPTKVLVFHILAIVPGCCLGLGLIFYALAMMEVQNGLNELWSRHSVHSAPPAIPGV